MPIQHVHSGSSAARATPIPQSAEIGYVPYPVERQNGVHDAPATLARDAGTRTKDRLTRCAPRIPTLTAVVWP